MPEYPESDSNLHDDDSRPNVSEQFQLPPEEVKKVLQPIFEGFNQVLRQHGIHDVKVVAFTTAPLIKEVPSPETRNPVSLNRPAIFRIDEAERAARRLRPVDLLAASATDCAIQGLCPSYIEGNGTICVSCHP